MRCRTPAKSRFCRYDLKDVALAPKSAVRPPDLTTTRAPFIEEARAHGEIYIIDQPYELYSEENQATWGRLLERMRDPWARYANRRFLEGMEKLQLSAARIPHLDEINRFMQPLTGFRARAVSGYVPSYVFFDCLRRREFPTTVTIRDGARLEYLPEPDIFHDVAGHVPMHTDRAFAAALVQFGACAAAAARRAAAVPDPRERLRRLTSNIRAMSRFFWFSVEFGLMRHAPGDGDGAVKVYGSGLLSSFGEIAHAIDAPDVDRRTFENRRSGQPAVRDRPLPTAPLHRRLVRPPVRAGERARGLDAGRQAGRRRARRAARHRERSGQLPSGRLGP